LRSQIKNKKDKKKTDKITKVITAASIAGIFFAISYFVFVKDVLQGPTVIFPTPEEKINSEGLPLKEKEKTAWIWQSPMTLKDEEWRQYLEFAKKEGLTTLYLDITDYTDIFEQIDVAKKERDLSAFNDALRNKVRAASELNIAIEAVAGQSHWGNSSHWYLPLELVSYVQKYNTSGRPEERLAGIQFDIEPAEQKDFDTSSESQKELMIREFLTLIEGIAKRVASESPTMRIGFAIPFWFDGASDRLGNIDYNGSSKPASEHVIDALSQAPNGYVALLAYRNQAEGDGGSIKQAQREFDYTDRAGRKVSIILAQEFTPIDEKTATFYGTKKNDTIDEISALRSAYESHSNFRGIAFHDLAYYKLMIEGS
jgi:hypothetical protein